MDGVLSLSAGMFPRGNVARLMLQLVQPCRFLAGQRRALCDGQGAVAFLRSGQSFLQAGEVPGGGASVLWNGYSRKAGAVNAPVAGGGSVPCVHSPVMREAGASGFAFF